MGKRLTNQFKLFSAGILLLTVLFFLFFDRSKHVPALEAVNPFNVDPYDAVGSFAVLLALFVAFLSALRAFRPYAGTEISSGGLELILRGGTVVISSIAVTLAADAIAVLRQASPTVGAPGGRTLIALMAALGFMTACAGRWLQVRLQDVARRSGPPAWLRATAICLASAVILATYPPAWDKGMAGGILTALLGMLILFAAVWGLATVIFPASEGAGEDVIDDLAAIYSWLKGRLGFLAGFFSGAERFARVPVLQSLLGWLNPRRHPWNAVVLGGVALGLALAGTEALGEGVSPRAGRFVLVGSVFIGIATAAVLVGYGVLGRFLGIYRQQDSVADPRFPLS